MGLFGGGGGDSGADEYIAEITKGKEAYEQEIRPIADQGFRGYQEIGTLLGLSGDSADREAAMGRFYDSPGIRYAQDQATQATQRQFAASGMTQSGNVLAALQERSMGLAGQQYNTYLGQLSSFAQPGLMAKQNLADMTYNYYGQLGQARMQEEQAKSGGGGGLGGMLGGALQGFGGGGGGGGGFGSMFSGITSMFGGGSLNSTAGLGEGAVEMGGAFFDLGG